MNSQKNILKYIDKPILVTGINHTGTTMIVEALKQLGIFMGDSGLEEIHNNEWTPYLNLNIQIMNEWSPDGWQAIEYPPIEEIEKYAERVPIPAISGRWGLKLPSLCILLPAYLKRFPNAQLVYCQRNKKDLIESLLRRDGRNRGHWEKFIQIMDFRFKQVAPKYHLVQYEDFCRNPVMGIKGLCDYLSIPCRINFNWLKKYITVNRINKC